MSVELDNLDRFLKDFDDLIKKVPQKRRELHEKIADLLKSEVDSNISGSVNDNRGKIKGWQEKHVGSGGGYAAVRPISTPKGVPSAKSPGAITNYLEVGHKIRKPSGKSKKYRARIKVSFVDGRWFYKKTRENIESKIIALIEDFAEDIAREIEGD